MRSVSHEQGDAAAEWISDEYTKRLAAKFVRMRETLIGDLLIACRASPDPAVRARVQELDSVTQFANLLGGTSVR